MAWSMWPCAISHGRIRPPRYTIPAPREGYTAEVVPGDRTPPSNLVMFLHVEPDTPHRSYSSPVARSMMMTCASEPAAGAVPAGHGMLICRFCAEVLVL